MANRNGGSNIMALLLEQILCVREQGTLSLGMLHHQGPEPEPDLLRLDSNSCISDYLNMLLTILA